jgi:hypothetical protein
MSELIALPSLVMSPTAFSAMASNLHAGLASLVQGGRVMLSRCPGLLQLNLDL